MNVHWMRCCSSGSCELYTPCLLILLSINLFLYTEITWTKLYQKPGKCKGAKLVLRPQFPPVYRESEMPNISNISEVVVIRNDVWKVGDLVDWWSDSCYWSGRLTEVLEHGKFRVMCLFYLFCLVLFFVVKMIS